MLYPASHTCVQCRLFGRDIIIGTVLRAKHGRPSLNRFTTSRATLDDSCSSPQSVTVYARLILCSNTFCNGPRWCCTNKASTVSRFILHHNRLFTWMASKLSTTLDGLQQQLLLLNALVALVAAQPPASDSPRRQLATTVAALLQLHCSYCYHSTTTVSYHSIHVGFS